MRSFKYFGLRAVVRGTVEVEMLHLLRRDRHVEPLDEVLNLFGSQLLLLVGCVAAFGDRAEAVTLHGFGQNDRGPPLCSNARLYAL